MYVICACSETCFTGFQGVQRDANMLVPDAQQPPADQDNELLLYKHALEYRYKQVWFQCIQIINWYILVHTKDIRVRTWYIQFRTEYVPSTSYNWWCFPYSSWACSGLCFDYVWLCGVGVSAVCSPVPLLHWGGLPCCWLGRLLDSTGTALLQLPPAPKGWKKAKRLEAWQSRRLRIGRILPVKRQTSVGKRLVMAARMKVPEMKCELELYEYVLIRT